MLFNSLAFLIFFPCVCLAYFLLPQRWRWIWLLAASCYFYMAFIPKYILILGALILVDYSVGRLLEQAHERARLWLLWTSITANVGLLFVFKYFNFFNENLAALFHAVHWNYSVGALSWALPIGLSFHTFQSLSYIIEVYRGNQKPERHLGIYALYVMFFPQLVAGPIERPQNLLHQFHEPHEFDAQRIASGLRLMAWGFFQKIVIADTAAVYVNRIFAQTSSYRGLALVLAVVLFAFQLYGDFSGYSDIARGSALVLGIGLMRNFDRPYTSRSIAEFWRRWHISLSTWLKDYVYFPLVRAIPRPGMAWICFSLFVTFLLSGVWHGAGWTYVAMGALHGTYLVTSLLTKKWREKIVTLIGLSRAPTLHAILQTLITFGMVCLGWIFFRASSISQAWYVLSHLLSTDLHLPHTLLDPYQWASLVLAILLVCVRELWLMRTARQDLPRPRSAFWRFVLDEGLIAWILFFGYFSTLPFIYFQF